MDKYIKFVPQKGKLVAEVMGIEGPGCKPAMDDTLQAMGLKADPGSESHKPEFAIETEKASVNVAG